MQDVEKDVIGLVAKKIRVEKPNLGRDDRLEDLGIESIDAVELIFELEEKFDIQIPYNANNPQMQFATVGDIVDAIKSIVQNKT
jgi:acyl carrier protein